MSGGSPQALLLLLLDAAGPGVGPAGRRAALRLLSGLGCRLGPARLRWAFKLFDSRGSRGRPPRRAPDFRELGPRAWAALDDELSGERAGERGPPGRPAPGAAAAAAAAAAVTRRALTEALLDYHWDRPDLASPAKPGPGPASPPRPGPRAFANALFLFAPCPRSQAELLRFVAGGDGPAGPGLPTPRQVMDSLLPASVRDLMAARTVTLYWVDTARGDQVWESPDHLGYWMLYELLRLVGGTIVPSELVSQFWSHDGGKPRDFGKESTAEPQFSPWTSILPFESTLNCLLNSASEYQASFPHLEGTLFLPQEGPPGVTLQGPWAVTLEPLTMHQSPFPGPVSIFLKGTVTHWTWPVGSGFGTESWVLRSSEGDSSSEQGILFQHLVRRLTAEEVQLVADVCPGEGWPPSTGLISPLSPSAAILTVLGPEEAAELPRNLLQGAVAENSPDPSLLRDVVSRALSQVQNFLEEEPAPSAAALVPEWAQQEHSHTSPWSPAVVESWFPFSNLSGANSNLMESFCLLQAISEETSKPETELTDRLSEFYQKTARDESATAGQEDHRKKRGVPRTPVRQKMKTMSRSLKMLNVARLNVKAQKSQPDGTSATVVRGKGTHKASLRRKGEKLEDEGRILRSSISKDFKSKEELLSHLNESYQKAVATGDGLISEWAQNMVSAVRMFLKSRGIQELEVACVDHVTSHLLKTSKGLRLHLGENLDKEAKVRECQLQVFLRLEMCLQCPSLQKSADEMEQLVEEVTNLLRIICLTEDPSYLARFLEDILALYINSIPKTLGDLYHSFGFALPQKLAAVLPVDFFSDDSVSQEGRLPPLSVPLLSRAASATPLTTEADQLEELRTRSAKKRRKNLLTRHRSVTEASQGLRQIEIPKVSKRTTRNENCHPGLQQQLPLAQKEGVQEVTNVRRNLFNQDMLSPSKRSLKKLPRSQSVSAVEGLKTKHPSSKEARERHKLLTKRVAETPLHKQISKRLLHRQIKGRSSDPGPEVDVVEESPEKVDSGAGLRRSPRIKQLAPSGGTHLGSFYSVSQPQSRHLSRVHPAQQEPTSTGLGPQERPLDSRGSLDPQVIQSPKRLFFGAVFELGNPRLQDSSQAKRLLRNSLGSENPTAQQTPRKKCWKSPSPANRMPRRSPRTPRRSPRMLRRSPRTPRRSPRTPRRSPRTPRRSPRTPRRSPRSPRRSPHTPRTSPSSLRRSPRTQKRLPRTLRRSPPPSQAPPQTPGKLGQTPAKDTPAKQKAAKRCRRGSSPPTWDALPSKPEVTPQKDSLPAEDLPFPPGELESRTPGKQGGQALKLLENSSRDTALTPGVPASSGQERTTSLRQAPSRHFQRSWQTIQEAAAASVALGAESPREGPEATQMQKSLVEAVPQPLEATPQKSQETIPQTPRGAGNGPPASTPPTFSWKPSPFSSLPHEASLQASVGASSVDSSPLVGTGERGVRGPQKSPEAAVATPLTIWSLITTPRKGPAATNPSGSPPPPPSKARKPEQGATPCPPPERSIQRCPPQPSADLPSGDLTEKEDLALPESSLKQQQEKTTPSLPGSLTDAGSPLTDVGPECLFIIHPPPGPQGSESSEASIFPTEQNEGSMTVASAGPESASSAPDQPSEPASPPKSSYILRRTADRRQRQAAARLGNPEAFPPFSRGPLKVASTCPPSYEVELEMQASGLPKLRIKRVDSSPPAGAENNMKTSRPLGEQSSFPELPGPWCSKHPGKLEASYVSPPCLRSSHSTPGKSGGQTYICQSCTPTRCPSSTTSPSQSDGGIPWTPSPKPKGKTTPDTIKDWPRRKKAGGTPASGKNERGVDLPGSAAVLEEEGEARVSELCGGGGSSQVPFLGDFELEGIGQLLDLSPPSDCEPQSEGSFPGAGFGLGTGKRPLGLEWEPGPRAKRTRGTRMEEPDPAPGLDGEQRRSPNRCSLRSSRQPGSLGDDEVFVSGSTPPSCPVKSCLSASGLRALTQSPLLYQGLTPSSRRTGVRDEESEPLPSSAELEESPFSRVISRRRSISRTYSRKRLLS
ncbi:treslin [Tachyglossus aculeatus]|uniref:treslin n=1 Tax=Tachyglossus aculeatus TaxID=9261 RepID=UPI0018F35688|nr:treslin [Tachyglossus aculeatus]